MFRGRRYSFARRMSGVRLPKTPPINMCLSSNGEDTTVQGKNERSNRSGHNYEMKVNTENDQRKHENSLTHVPRVVIFVPRGSSVASQLWAASLMV